MSASTIMTEDMAANWKIVTRSLRKKIKKMKPITIIEIGKG